MTLFGTDGIRGKYGDYPLDSSTIRKLGSAISKSFNDARITKILIAHDGRESCMDICKNLVQGIFSDRKYEIIYLDLFPTPALTYLLSQNTDTDAIGIEITASHNPYTDNGIKIFDKLGFKIKSDLEYQIEKKLDGEIKATNNINSKLVSNDSVRAIYINFISKLINMKIKQTHKLHIAVDCANGALSKIISEIKWPKNIRLTIMNNSPNGININYKCGAVHPEYLSNIIRKSNEKNDSEYIDFGVCFDGDGDRAIIIRPSGNVLDGDDLLYLFSLSSKDNKKVVGTVMTNFGIRENLKVNGIDFLETDVGDKNVLESVIDNQAYIGAESSGHIIHTNTASIPIGDGLISLIKLIHLQFNLNKNIEEIYPNTLKIPSKLINIESKSPDKFLSENKIIFTKVENILGNNGRILVRKSGTQSLVRVLIEHKSNDVLNEAEELINSIKLCRKK